MFAWRATFCTTTCEMTAATASAYKAERWSTEILLYGIATTLALTLIRTTNTAPRTISSCQAHLRSMGHSGLLVVYRISTCTALTGQATVSTSGERRGTTWRSTATHSSARVGST